MVSRQVCGDLDRLKLFLADDLSVKDQMEVTKHLDQCTKCQAALEQLAATSVIWRELPGLGEREAGANGERVVRGEGSVSGSGREPLGFLAPSDDPAYLGKLGPYLVSSVLGEGGMGIVLKAFDPSLSRMVAVKVLAPAMAASGAARRRFSREAKAAAAVVHDHVVAIHAVDRDGHSGLPYLVMPYIAGLSLQQRIDLDGPLEPEEVLRIGMQTALGLAAAHAQGLVHRDIKPSNILLENGLERVKITDFGLARAVDDASQTQSGVVAGTPDYMAPEQARGETVDHRADLFSLGSVLYAMCAGHPPFRAKTMMGVLRRVCDEAPRPLREIDPSVPRELAQIVEKLHAKDASKRYASASAVADALERQLARQQRPGGRVVAERGLALGRAAQRLADYTKGSELPDSRPRKVGVVMATVSAALVLAVLTLSGAMGTSGSIGNLAAMVPGAEGFGELIGWAGDDEGADSRRLFQFLGDKRKAIEGSGKLETRGFEVAGFTGVKIAHGFRGDVTRGDKFSVLVTADDNVLGHVKVTKEGNTLGITLEEGFNYRLKGDSLNVAITMPDLESIDVSHGSRTLVNGFTSTHPFVGKLSHGSVLEGMIATGPITLDLSHGSEAKLAGSGGEAKLSAVHGSKLSLDGLKVGNADVRLEHGSTAVIHAAGDSRVKAKLSHGSRLKGSASAKTVELDASHGSDVELSGAAESGTIGGSHSSRFGLANLVINDGVVKIDQGTSATVHVAKHLMYKVGDSARLKYVGQPAVTGSVSKQGGSAKAVSIEETQAEKPAAEIRPVAAPAVRPRVRTISVGRKWGVNAATIVGSGKTASKAVALKNFNTVVIDRTIRAEVVRSDTFGVTLTADDNVLEHIETILKGTTLTVRLAEGSYSTKEQPRVVIQMPSLDAIHLDGASGAVVRDFKSDRPFKISVNGASKLTGSIGAGDVVLDADGASSVSLLGTGRNANIAVDGASRVDLSGFGLKAEVVKLDADGASSVRLKGSARSVTLSGDGSSQLALAELPVETAVVNLDGASRGEIAVKGSLNYNVSGGSTLKYQGEPRIGKAVKSGGGKVSR